MKILTSWISLAALVFGFSSFSALAAEEAQKTVSTSVASNAQSFSGESKRVVDYIEKLFSASKHVNEAGAPGEKARKEIESALDWNQVAEICLGKAEWKKQSPKNREQFKNLLKDVVLKTAFSRLDKFWEGNMTYRFQKVSVNANKAEVPTKFMVKGQPFVIDYYLAKVGSQWKIYDVSYEDIRYSENINEQIDAFLKENSFASLLGKLRKRREELSEDAKAGAAEKNGSPTVTD